MKWLGNKLDKVRTFLGGKKHTATMSNNDKLMAYFANESYQDEHKRNKNKGGYEYDNTLSGKYESVYHNPKSNKTVISYRGTKFDINDLESDIAIISGKEDKNKRFQNALNHFDKVQNKYKGNISTTGHSLGASISEHVNKNRDVHKAYSFNAGSSITAVKDMLKCKLPKSIRPKWCDKLRCHKIGGDVISMAGCGYGKATTYKKKSGSLSSHSIQNFL